MAATGQYRLEIGESTKIKRGVLSQTELLYAGMPNDRTFSLVVTKIAGYMGMAYNLYLPTDQRHVTIGKFNITIDSISPTSCLLTID